MDVVADPVPGAREPGAVLGRHGLEEPMVVRVLEVDLEDVVVDVDDRGVHLYPVLAEHLELHHRHRPRRVLHERLVDRDADLLARDELTPDEVLFEDRARQRGHQGSVSQERADPLDGVEVAMRRSPPRRCRRARASGARRGRARRRAAPSRCRPAGSSSRRARAGRKRGTARPRDRRRPGRGALPTRASEAASRVSSPTRHALRDRLLAPARDRRGLGLRLCASSRKGSTTRAARRRRVRLGRRPADDGASHLIREQVVELGRVSSEETTTTGARRRRTWRSSSSATSRRCSCTSFSMCRS